MNLEEYRKELLEDIRVSAEFEMSDIQTEFVKNIVEVLQSAEEFDDFVEGYFEGIGEKNRKICMDGYYFDPYDKSCIILISDFSNNSEISNLIATDIDKLYNNMRYLIEASISGYITSKGFEESSIGYGFAKELQSQFSDIVKFRFYIITDKKLSDKVKTIKKDPIVDRIVELNVWDISRIYSVYSSTLGKESIEIDFTNAKNGGLCCVKAVDTEDYSSYLAVIPGNTLAEMYIEYGSRLLEGNVRSFLSVKGKVNKEIRKTILNEPKMFFAYNNGIAATAASIEIEQTEMGLIIKRITDLQIINGGQTTASIANAVLQDKCNVSNIYIPMKLSVVEHEKATEMIPTISRCANSQNKVDEADFFSNHPYHVRLEEYSRKIYAPAVDGNQYQTIWFYERARGQYTQEQMKLSVSERKKYQIKNPKTQLLKKVDLAKYINTFECLPQVVSKGAQTSMRYFAEKISKEWDSSNEKFNDFYYRKIISYAIIFKNTEKLVFEQDWYKEIKAYRANIVTYSIAVIVNEVKKNHPDKIIDFKKIWNMQRLYPSFEKQLLKTTYEIFKFITRDDRPTLNVTEWCKKELCWSKARELNFNLLDDFINDLILASEENAVAIEAKKDRKVENQLNSEILVVTLGDEYWKNVQSWGLTHKLLTPMENDLLKIASYATVTGKIPSTKQANLILQIQNKLFDESMPKEF